jgi:hypothetical protein
MLSIIRRLSTTVVLCALVSTAALAEGQRTTAMLWGSAIEGTLQVGGGTAEFDMSVEDILNVLDGSITLRHESRGAARGWYAELVFNDLKQTVTGTLGERQANLEQTIFELGLSQPIAEGWEVYGGARWESVDNSIEFIALPTVAAGTDWADAVLGVRWHRDSDASRWWMRGDIAGGGSDGAYLLEAGGAWRFGGAWELSLAYRLLDTKVEDNLVFFDLQQSGAVFGVAREW